MQHILGTAVQPRALTPTKLIGDVSVNPASAQPGVPVTVQVYDASGQPYGDAGGSVLVTINGVECARRVFQFATMGEHQFVIRAVEGDQSEVRTVSVTIAGEALSFSRSASAAPVTSLPMIEASRGLGSAYAATFTIGTPDARLRSMAVDGAVSGVDAGQNGNPAKPTRIPGFADALAAVSLEQAVSMPPRTTPAPSGGTATTSALAGPLDVSIPINPSASTVYEWDFGDGTSATTYAPTVAHDYLAAIKADQVAHTFDVTCTISQARLDAGGIDIGALPVVNLPAPQIAQPVTVTRTFVVHSAYGLSRRLGTIVPPVVGDVFATSEQDGFAGSLIVHNLESQPITLTRMAYVPLHPDPTADLPSPAFTTMSTPLTVDANGSSGLGVFLLVSQLQHADRSVPGFIVWYSGTAADNTPVRFSYTFQISVADQRAAFGRSNPASSMKFGGLVPAIENAALDPAGPISRRGAIAFDPATQTVAIPLTADAFDVATSARVRKAVGAGLTALSEAQAVDTPAPLLADAQPEAGGDAAPVQAFEVRRLDAPPPPGPVQLGQVCDPDDISAADATAAASQGLVCQLTNQTETVLMPGSIQNAFKGDVVLNAGDDSPIGTLLRALSPPQLHAHTGIMTKNFVEITHCTASMERFADYAGPSGVQPDVLQYGWPGSITQSVDAAVGDVTENWVDPANGKSYPVMGFHSQEVGLTTSDGFELIPTLVVKPLPEHEASVRPVLRAAADIAHSKGARVDASGHQVTSAGAYYSFYGYTRPEVAAGFGDPAPSSAGWAAGLSPAVCSSFVWLCMKEAGANLVTTNAYETPADLTPAELAAGAVAGAGTLDGLFYYSVDERTQAGQVLKGVLQNQILNQEGWVKYFAPISTYAASSVADQFMNMFAFGSPNMYGSSAWQAPGDGNAVSPDNIEFWHLPFGYVEPVQYLQQHTETYTVSRWTQIISKGSISGTVTLSGQPVAGATVWVYDGKSTVTNGAGRYELDDVPVGSYMIKAQVVQGGINYRNLPTGQGQVVEISAAAPNVTFDVALQVDPEEYRTLDLVYTWNSDHGDANPTSAHGTRYAGPESTSASLGPGMVTNMTVVQFDYAGGGLFRCRYQFNTVLAQDLSIQVTLIGQIVDDNSNGVQAEQTITFNVPKDGQWVWQLPMEFDGFGFHNGPSLFTGTATNRRETT